MLTARLGSRVVVMALAATLAAVGCGGARSVHVEVSPASSVEDQPLTIAVSGLKPHQRVTLTLSSTDAAHQRFVASDAYRADAQGIVDLGRAQPLAGGGYTGVWPMGLLVSMTAQSPAPYYVWGRNAWGLGVRRFTLSVRANGKELAQASFRRGWPTRGYRRVSLSVAANGIAGRYVAPAGARRRPALLAFGGSEGGEPGWGFPGQFASHGLPTLTVGYFHAPGLPNRLVNVPLEYFERALTWLSRQPEVDPNRISVLGISYGSEAALLLGVHDPGRVHQVVALVPSSVVTCGIMGAGRNAPTLKWCLGSPWSLNGKPLPHTALINNTSPWDTPAAVIPVECIRGRVFLVCAGADEEWRSCPYAKAIVARRRRHHEQTTLFAYPDATHAVGSPFIDYPSTLANLVFPSTELDRERYYPLLIRFLTDAKR